MSTVSSPDKEDTDNTEHDDEVYLSNHTISMRAALKHCRVLLDSSPADAETMLPPHLYETALDAYRAATSIAAQRRKALEDIYKDPTISIIEYSNDFSVLDFRKRFLHANRPCLIRSLNHYFARVSTQWHTSDSQVNQDWFLKEIGKDTVIPVRQQAVEDSCLDEDGRADECNVSEMTLDEWCHHSTSADSPHLYLKDWHFQKWWQEHHQNEPPLYKVPPLFRNDLLNKLLLQFTEGDYRFVYWGPAGSQTPLHSDVLHSFSWSYNVVGEKKWTFYIPNSDEEIVLHQRAGEMVFVPSTWKHKVENLCETLSINHNWITSAAIDYTWECLLSEMAQVDAELAKWDNTNEAPSLDAKEFMLRGCVGLDVTAFFFMVTTELVSLLTQDVVNMDNEETWERYFDMFRLALVLDKLLDPEIQLRGRLAAILEQDVLAVEAMNVAETAARVVHEVKATIVDCER